MSSGRWSRTKKKESVGARVEYPSIAELVDILFYAHSRVEVVLWLRAIVRD
jgi:hypothetical protein